MESALRDLESLRCILYVNYRLALKINSLQKHCVFNRVHHKFMYGTLTSPAVVASDGLLVLSQVNDILAMVYREVKRISKNTTDAQIDEAKGVCMNFILMIFDCLSGSRLCYYQVSVIFLLLSVGKPSDKAECLFNLLSKDGKLTKVGVNNLFKALDRLLSALQESLPSLISAVSSGDVASVVDNFWTTALPLRSRDWIGSAEFVQSFASSESLKWITLSQRINGANQCVHQVQCSSCKAKPISGLLYMCLRCPKVLLCQMCHLVGKEFDDHIMAHPVREYQSSPVLERPWHQRLLCISSTVSDGRPMVDKVQPCRALSQTPSVHDLDTPERSANNSPNMTRANASSSCPLLSTGDTLAVGTMALGRVHSFKTNSGSGESNTERNKRFLDLLERKREMEKVLKQYHQLESEAKEEKDMKSQIDHLLHVRQHLAHQLEDLVDKIQEMEKGGRNGGCESPWLHSELASPSPSLMQPSKVVSNSVKSTSRPKLTSSEETLV